MVCALDGIGAILGNTFLNIYRVNVLKRGSKLKVITRLTNRYVSLKVEYQTNLAKVSIQVISLQELQEISFLILMHVDECNTKVKTKRVKSWSTCISNTINKVSNVLMNKPLNIYFLLKMWTKKLRLYLS
jgi:hypothetical protein